MSSHEHINVTTLTQDQVVQVDRFKGTGGFVEMVGGRRPLEVKRVCLDKNK